MKLIKLCAAALCAVMLLSACSLPKSADAQMDDIRNFIASCSDVALNAHITADYGDRIFSFTVKYEGNDTGGRIEVIKPEEIAGITAQVSYDDGITLSFDGVMLASGRLYEDGLTPVDAIPMMLTQWKRGYISDCAAETYGGVPCIAATMAVTDEISLRTWFDKETMLPLRAEASCGGFMIIGCDFENIQMN